MSAFSSRSKDSSRMEASRSVILTVLSEVVVVVEVVVERTELEKIELEVGGMVCWLEVNVGMEDSVVERYGWVEEIEVRGNSVCSSDGILQMGWWAARMNSSRSFSFSRLAISFCRLDFSSSSWSVSYQMGKKERKCHLVGCWIGY